MKPNRYIVNKKETQKSPNQIHQQIQSQERTQKSKSSRNQHKPNIEDSYMFIIYVAE